MTSEQESKRRLIPVSKWPQIHEWPPLGGLRHLIFNAKQNGFDKVIRRIGRTVLIDEGAFFEWVDKGGQWTNKNQPKQPKRNWKRNDKHTAYQ